MIECRENHFLFVEKYRPQVVSDCILPDRLKSYFRGVVDSAEITHHLLSGGPGCGKTTVAKALCNELDIDYLMINASENGNIDTLRTTIRSFASTMSFTSKYKVVILDEADSLSSATMSAMRSFMEEFASNCRFIMTCNFSNKIIEPLKSRCANITFEFSKAERQQMLVDFDKRVRKILENENIQYDKKNLAHLIMKFFPDFRRILNELQRYSKSGTLSNEVINSFSSDSINELYGLLKSPANWGEMRKWVAVNSDNDPNLIFRGLYDRAADHLKPASVPQLVLHIANYSYKGGFVADQEINLVAALTEIMSDCEFK